MRNVLPNSGSEIAASWSPTQLQIEPWQPEFSFPPYVLEVSCAILAQKRKSDVPIKLPAEERH